MTAKMNMAMKYIQILNYKYKYGQLRSNLTEITHSDTIRQYAIDLANNYFRMFQAP
jgi:hypothetical protein